MKEIIKKYLPHIFSISFLVYVNILFYIINNNVIVQNKEYILMLLILLEFLFVIGVFGEMIYYFIKVSKNEELKGNPLYYILIYMLNIFYIPCFTIKHIQKDENHKKKNIIFIIIMVILYLMLTINILNLEPAEATKSYNSIDNNVTLTISEEYEQRIVGEYDLYFSKGDINIGLFLYDNEEETSDEILNYQAGYIAKTRDNVKQISKDERIINDRKINTIVYKGKMDDVENTYMMSTITSTKKNGYIVYVIEITSGEDYLKNKDEMQKVLDNIIINE